MLKEGIYEQIIYEDLKNKLKELGSDKYVFQKEPIDAEEAKTQLSSYISSVVKKCLRFIRENNKQNDTEALLSQIRACNDLIQGLSKLAEDNSKTNCSQFVYVPRGSLRGHMPELATFVSFFDKWQSPLWDAMDIRGL